MTNVDIFIPARLASKRLPKKHLMKIKNKTIIELLVNKLRKSKKIRRVIVCTTKLKSDDDLVNFLKEKKIDVFRGNNKDILVRFLEAAKIMGTDIIIDVEGDKIFTDIRYVDLVAEKMIKSNYDFIIGGENNKFNPSSPLHGFIPAAFSILALEKICDKKNTHNTETGYKEFFLREKQLKKFYMSPKKHVEFPENSRFALDYKEDFEIIEKIFEKLGTEPNMNDVKKFIEKNPDIFISINKLNKKWKKNYSRKITK